MSANEVGGEVVVLRDEHHDGDDTWTIEAHDDQPVAEGKKYAANRRVVVLLNGERVREFLYPSYRIWTLLAHWTEGIDGLRAALTTTPAASSEQGGDGPNVAGSDHASADGSEDGSDPGETLAEVIGRERGML